MSDNLVPDEYVPYAPDDAGQIKMQHELCESGKDHKERLYIRRMANGTIKAKCHNCGKAGVFTEPAHVRNLHTLLKKDKEDLEKTGCVALPSDCIDISHKEAWPDKALAYLYIADLTDKEIDECHIAYSKKYDRVIVPVYLRGTLISWQGRDIQGNEPKYITMTAPNLDFKPYWACGHSLDGTLFLVEDVLSAKRIAMCGYKAAALFGTYANQDQITMMAKNGNKKAVVFLDDDNATVKKEARRLLDNFNAIFEEDGFIIQKGKDPKRHGRKELCTLLKNALTAHLEGRDLTLSVGDRLPPEYRDKLT
jgi:hypothetical protein